MSDIHRDPHDETSYLAPDDGGCAAPDNHTLVDMVRAVDFDNLVDLPERVHRDAPEGVSDI